MHDLCTQIIKISLKAYSTTHLAYRSISNGVLNSCANAIIYQKVQNIILQCYSIFCAKFSNYTIIGAKFGVKYSIMPNFGIKFTLTLLPYYNFKILNSTVSNVQLIINLFFNTQSIHFSKLNQLQT